MGVTPVYAFPYPELTDPPNGPSQIQALATAVENKFVTVDSTVSSHTSSISTLQTTVNTLNLRSLGGRIVTTAGVINAGITTTEVNVTKAAFENSTITSGRVYIFTFTFSAQFTTANDSFLIRIRKDTALSGTVLVTWAIIPQVSGFSHYVTQRRPWIAPASDADADFYISFQRIAGSGSCDINGNSETTFFIEEVVGPTDWISVA